MSEERLEATQAADDADDVVDAGDAPEADAPEPAPVRAWSEDMEAEARLMGWKSPDEWQGEKPPGYIDNPEDYIKRWDNLPPVKKLREKLTAQEREFADRIKRIERVHEQASKREVERIRREMERAVELGDVDKFRALEKERDGLTQPQQPQAQPLPPGMTDQDAQLVSAWLTLNPDFAQSPDADRLFFQELAHMPVRDRMREIETRLRQPAPAQQRPAASRVDGGGVRMVQKKAGFDTLPSEAKAAFQKFAAQGLFTDDAAGRAAYYKEYTDG